jgi:CheY-like chemotaxis protein
MRKRYLVWLVDDREENRKDFQRRHGGNFEIELFETPDQVLQAIENGRRPDALLCDVYFFEDPARREQVEAEVMRQVDQLKKTLPQLSLDNADGIQLIEDIRTHLAEPPHFPIYAYTSKGPYLLQNEGFDRLENLDARWLFKGKHSPLAERHRITGDIREFKDRFNWRKRLWQVAVATGSVSAILGIVLDRLSRQYLGF